MRHLLLLLFVPALCLAADAGLVNGDFAADADHDGVPDGWATSGDQGVQQTLRRETLPDGRACALLACTAFAHSGPASHCMLAQVGSVKLTQGEWYRLRFRVKGEAVAAGSVDMAISDTKTWSNCGLHDGVFLSPDWAWYETTFRATQTVGATSRLQFWFGSTGRVWFADMTLESTTAPRRQYVERMPETAARNRVPNGSFECGEAGWGSVTDVPGWAGNLNRLVGRVIDTGAHSGGRCLEIAVSPRNLLTYWFDYFEMQRQPVRMPLAANRGWLGVEPDRGYTLSAWVRADPPGQTVVLRAQHAGAGHADQRVRAGGTWSRVAMSFKARGDQCYVAVGPDLAADQRDTATLWVDDVMLEAGDTAGAFEPRGSVEVGVRVPREGGLFAPGEPLQVAATAANHTDAARRVALRWVATDFHDKEVDRGEQTVDLAAHAWRELMLPVRASRRGFYRVVVTADGAEVTPPLPLRLAVIPTNQRTDTLVGMNHGYPTGDLLDLSRRIGLGWFRDWSYKWQHVEPERGRFDFAAADAQVDRVIEHRLNVLALLPFPSAPWSSEAPPITGPVSYDQNMQRNAHAPRDPADLANYVRQTVAHLKGRVDSFEIFNEPIYTEYALSREFGYKPADYARLLAVAAKAARGANPQAKIIGGIQSPPGPLVTDFIAAGGAGLVDALSFHMYPGKAQPESYVAGFEQVRAELAAAGQAKLPLYFTEGAYYADDDPVSSPYNSDWMQLLPTERLAAGYTLRLSAILCGYGTQRIIWHSGTPGSINEVDPSGIYFEYDGLPRRLVPVLATFNELVGPDVTTRGRLKTAPDTYAYALDTGGRTVVIAWALGPGATVAPAAGWRVLDMLGNPLAGAVTLAAEPVYLVGERVGMVPGW